MRESNWHRKGTRAETDKIALLQFGTTRPVPGSEIPSLDIAGSNLVVLRKFCACIVLLNDVGVADTIATRRRWTALVV